MCPGFNGALRDYQLKGVKWLISLWSNGLNGILADQVRPLCPLWLVRLLRPLWLVCPLCPPWFLSLARCRQPAAPDGRGRCHPLQQVPGVLAPPPTAAFPAFLRVQMGLGKTVQTIGFLCHLRNAGHINGPYMVRVQHSWQQRGRLARPTCHCSVRALCRTWVQGGSSACLSTSAPSRVPMRPTQLLCAPSTLCCAGAGPAVHFDQLGQRV